MTQDKPTIEDVKNEYYRLIELQSDHTRWFSQQEFERLQYLSELLNQQTPKQ